MSAGMVIQIPSEIAAGKERLRDRYRISLVRAAGRNAGGIGVYKAASERGRSLFVIATALLDCISPLSTGAGGGLEAGSPGLNLISHQCPFPSLVS